MKEKVRPKKKSLWRKVYVFSPLKESHKNGPPQISKGRNRYKKPNPINGGFMKKVIDEKRKFSLTSLKIRSSRPWGFHPQRGIRRYLI